MSLENPYQSPAAMVEEVDFSVPEEIAKKIKNAWSAALFSAGITLIFVILAISGTSVLGISVWESVDVALMLGLAYGIYKKSRICAVAIFVYFIAAKILLISQTGNTSGIALAIVFLYFYFNGILGTFAYHRLKKEKRA